MYGAAGGGCSGHVRRIGSVTGNAQLAHAAQYVAQERATWRLDGATWRLDGATWRLDHATWRLDHATWRLDHATWRLPERSRAKTWLVGCHVSKIELAPS